MENLIVVTRNKSVRGTYATACFTIGMGLVLALSAFLFHRELRAFPLTLFVGASAAAFFLSGLGILWVAIRKR